LPVLISTLCRTYGFNYDYHNRQDRVIVWNPKTCRLVGGVAEFTRQMQDRYGITCDYDTRLLEPVAQENTQLFAKRRERNEEGRRIVVCGPPGSGKTTQAKLLAVKFGIPRVQADELLLTASRAKSAEGEALRAMMERKQPIPDELLVELVQRKLQESQVGWILDGFPGTVNQMLLLGLAQRDPHALVAISISLAHISASSASSSSL
jgi:hypothetical protein